MEEYESGSGMKDEMGKRREHFGIAARFLRRWACAKAG
jgi:hypothetical protein